MSEETTINNRVFTKLSDNVYQMYYKPPNDKRPQRQQLNATFAQLLNIMSYRGVNNYKI